MDNEIARMMNSADAAQASVEVIVSDGRIISRGSQWGHVAIDVDGIVYGMSHNGYDTRPRETYLLNNAYRDSIGVVLRTTHGEKF